MTDEALLIRRVANLEAEVERLKKRLDEIEKLVVHIGMI